MRIFKTFFLVAGLTIVMCDCKHSPEIAVPVQAAVKPPVNPPVDTAINYTKGMDRSRIWLGIKGDGFSTMDTANVTYNFALTIKNDSVLSMNNTQIVEDDFENIK